MKAADPSRATWPLLLAVAMIGLNLRPFITGVGPLAQDIQAGTRLGLHGISLLTLVPMLLMGLLAFAGPSLQGAIGARRSVITALMILGAGSLLRLFTTTGWALIGTAAIIGFGVAIVQAIFPGIIKRMFPAHTAKVMGLYSATLMGGGALGAKASPIVAGWAGDWHLGLAWLVVPAAFAVLLAVRYLPMDSHPASRNNAMSHLLRRPRTWLLMVWFGVANGGYSSIIAWLPPSYQALGWKPGASGDLLALMATCQATAALILPLLIRHEGDHRGWLLLTLACQAFGFAGLAFSPQIVPYLWAALAGAGLGGFFALSMVVVLDHLPNPIHAGALAALMQGGGFLIAAIPPWIVAVLHDATDGFRAGWLLHLACVIIVMLLTLPLVPHGYKKAMPCPTILW